MRGCAFLDTNTGETIIGFARINDRNGTKEFAKDVITGMEIVFTGINSNSEYTEIVNKFFYIIKFKNYEII